LKRYGAVRLLITAAGPKRRTQNRTGTATVRATVTYTAIGGAPTTRSTSIRLRKR